MPPRTNITLESFDMANMGGDLYALAFHCIIALAILIIIETGICLSCSKSCKSASQRADSDKKKARDP